MQLSAKHCVPCEGGVPPANDEEIARLSPHVPRWQIVEVEGVKRLKRTFRFKNFVESVAFVNRVAGVAEAEGHHPDVHIAWNQVRLELWTHAIRGLHENDFILAAKVNALLGE